MEVGSPGRDEAVPRGERGEVAALLRCVPAVPTLQTSQTRAGQITDLTLEGAWVEAERERMGEHGKCA